MKNLQFYELLSFQKNKSSRREILRTNPPRTRKKIKTQSERTILYG